MTAGSLQGYGGAIAATSDDESAFSHRHAFVEFVASAGWTDPAEDDEQMDAARSLAPRSSLSRVVSTSTRSPTRVRAECAGHTPAAKLARLAASQRYDPTTSSTSTRTSGQSSDSRQ